MARKFAATVWGNSAARVGDLEMNLASRFADRKYERLLAGSCHRLGALRIRLLTDAQETVSIHLYPAIIQDLNPHIEM